jgi:hypothetical protein
MALNNPYASNTSHANEYKIADDILTSTSVFPPIEQPFEDHIDLSNQIILTNNMETSDENVLTDRNHFSPISPDANSPLFNQETNELLTKSADILSNVNDQISSVHKPKKEYNGSFVSHMPMISSSSSTQSIPVFKEQTVVSSQIEKINLNDPRTRSIVIGQETFIEIDREQAGLGVSVVGGADTQLVK